MMSYCQDLILPENNDLKHYIVEINGDVTEAGETTTTNKES